MMVGLGNKQPVSASLYYKNSFHSREDEVDVIEQRSPSDAESESGRSSEISSIDSSVPVPVDNKRKCCVEIQALVSAAFKDKESFHLNGRGRLENVICGTKKEIMKIDETVEVLTPSSENLPSSSSEMNHEVGSDEGHRNGNCEDTKEAEGVPENAFEVQNTVVPNVHDVPTDDEVLERLGGIVRELVNVEGYEESPWGSAVEVENKEFYPTASTRPLKEDEYREFLRESEDEKSGSESQEFKTCIESASGNTTSTSLVDELQDDNDALKMNPAENVSNETKIVDLDKNPPEVKGDSYEVVVDPEENPLDTSPNELVIVKPEESQLETSLNGFIIVDPEDNPSGKNSNELVIVDPEENPAQGIPCQLASVDPEETLPQSIPIQLASVVPEENLPQSIPSHLATVDLGEIPPENESNQLASVNPDENQPVNESHELPIADPEENLPCSNSSELATTVDHQENAHAEGSCNTTNPVEPEVDGDGLSMTEFDKLEEITDDFIDVFIKGGEEDPLLDHDLNIEFGNATESAPAANDAQGRIDDTELQEKEHTAEASGCPNICSNVDTINGDSSSGIVSTNDEQTEHASRLDVQVVDEAPAEKCLQNIDSSKESQSPMSSVSGTRGSVRDPRLRRRTRSFEDSASQVSVASTSSSHSSLRACSVILTRVDASPSASPVRLKTKPDNSASPSVKSNTGESMEHDQSEGDLAGSCDDKNNEQSIAAPMSDKSSEEVSKLTLQKDPGPDNNDVEADDVNMDDEPIRLYEPINLDDPSDAVSVEDDTISNKTEVIMEAASDVSSEPVRTTRKRKSSAKAAEAKKARPNSMRRESTENPGKSLAKSAETEVKKGRPSSMKRESTENSGKASAKSAETEVKRGRPSSSKRESTENPGTLLSSMSKREIMAYVKKEAKKAQPDFVKLSEAMDITYDPTRKTMYDKGEVDMDIIKKKHPELLHYQMAKDELGRILKDPTKMERLEKELSDEVLSSALEGKKKTSFNSKKRHPLWQKTIKLWGENKGSENSTQYQRVLGMLAVCFEFSENAVVNKLCTILKQNGTLSEKDTDKMDTPTIVVKESDIFSVVEEADIWIYVDGEKYIKVPNMYEAVLSVFAAYYIFNISYDKSLKSLFEFFDYLCDNRQSTYKSSAKKWRPELRIGVKEFPVLTP